MLDPGLRHADALLATTLADVCSVLPDEPAAAHRLNGALMSTGATPQLFRRHGRWHIIVIGHDPLAEAVTALAVLVVAGGWRRLKRCAHCGHPFVDRTAGATRLGCAEHLARVQQPRSAKPAS
jgi:hypothetical protein